MQPIRVFGVDDHPMIRHGLAAMLAAETDLLWVGAAASGPEAVREAPTLAPDVLLVDLAMPGMDGLATCKALAPLLPQARCLLLVSAADPADLRRGAALAGTACLAKTASAAELATMVRNVHRGQAGPLPGQPAQGRSLPNLTAGAGLTQRERELLGLMARGLSNQDISVRLGIAMPTVKFHVTNILAKLRADNRTEAVLVALRHKIVSLE